MAATTSLRTLNDQEVLERLRALRTRQPVKFWAFYSSQLGGIVTDPALMIIPFDDHMVHRGHGIFDTAAIMAGKIYDLEAHLDRFVRSARMSVGRIKGALTTEEPLIGSGPGAGRPPEITVPSADGPAHGPHALWYRFHLVPGCDPWSVCTREEWTSASTSAGGSARRGRVRA